MTIDIAVYLNFTEWNL